MTQQKCHISCVGGITGFAPVCWSKQNRGISSVEVPCKLCGWHDWQESCPHAMLRLEVWPWGFAWASGKLYKPGKISTPVETRREWKRLTEELLDVTLLWVLASHLIAQGWEVEKSLSCIRLAKEEKWR